VITTHREADRRRRRDEAGTGTIVDADGHVVNDTIPTDPDIDHDVRIVDGRSYDGDDTICRPDRRL
jgi:hypothetical protein